MITLHKKPDKDFKILNITDPQLSNEEWADTHKNRAILTHTITELVKSAEPDLITVTGDLAWAGHDVAYDALADFLDSFGIPWAPIWGNHDNQGGAEYIDTVADRYLGHKYCIYEKGDPSIGNGNYVIAVEENGKTVSAILMIDSHDRMPYTDADGNEQISWARLTEPQMAWYREQITALQAMGCDDTSIIMHIPFYAYNTAYLAAYANADEASRKQLTPETAIPDADCWNPGYEDSIGVQYEGIGSYTVDEGVFDIVRDLGSTKHVIVGHDHVNNWMINYQGVKLVFSMKAGAGCYWTPILNGGTVISIGSEGVQSVHHEYVDVSAIVDGE